MKKFFCTILIILCVFLFSFCKRNEDNCLSYQQHPFEGLFEVSSDSLTFSAAVSGDSWVQNSCSPRKVVVKFTSPSSLCGITVTRTEDKTSASLGNITLEGDGDTYSSLADFTLLLELNAVPTDFKTENGNTRAILAEKDNKTISLLLDKNGLPLEISDGDITVKVISYTVKD